MNIKPYTVSISGLHKSYLEGSITRKVLSDADADFEAGRMHVITGRSGSGKSTLLNLIAGIDSADKGSIEIAGVNITSLNKRQRTLLRRKNIGIVFQFFNLIASLTTLENVMLPLELNKHTSRTKKANEMLERVGLADRRDSFPSSLSGGEQQRAAIARAVVHEPDLILADEPTGNLDEHAAQQVMRTLVEASRLSTVIVVTHSNEIAESCNSRWHLKSGKLNLR